MIILLHPIFNNYVTYKQVEHMLSDRLSQFINMDLNGVKVNSLLSSPLPQPHNTGVHVCTHACPPKRNNMEKYCVTNRFYLE